MLLVDAGPLYAAAARRDRNHQRSVELLSSAARPLLVPALVITEIAYLLGDRIGPHAELAFARSLQRGELLAEPVPDSDWSRIAELTDQHRGRDILGRWRRFSREYSWEPRIC